MATVHLLVNPARRGNDETDAAIVAALAEHGHEAVEIRPTAAAQVADEVRAAIANGMTRLVVAGGDGLIHRALPALAHSDIPVGLVSGGTGNDFARALDLPTDVTNAVARALDEPTPVDIIKSDEGTYAASIITAGFSGRVNARANAMRFPRGESRYTIATLRELYALRPIELSITIDDTTIDTACSFFAVANSRFFGGGMAICPDADHTDGLLDVTVVGSTTRFELGRMLPTVFSGRHVRHPAVTTFRGRRVEVQTNADLWADGEPFTGSGFSSDHRALRVAGSLV
ncbi:MAG: YegS/Rv2252/BmrU family lipid kinase [Actinomycetota bacterium]